MMSMQKPSVTLYKAMCALATAAVCAVVPGQRRTPNPYRLAPFHDDFPAELEYPPMHGREYTRTRRQMLARLCANLQGNVRRETWKVATEFFWRAPEDCVEPLIEAMDRAMGDPAFGDVVRNCVEAMGKMADPAFDAALQRALGHKSRAVRQAAYRALTTSGSLATLRSLGRQFGRMDGRTRQSWLTGVRTRLPQDRVKIFKDLMMSQYPTPVRDQVLKEVVQMPAHEAAEVLRGRWDEALDEFKAIIAGVRHANGEAAGTAWLLEAMRGEDLKVLQQAIRHCLFGEDADAIVGPLREPLLRATTHLRPEIRVASAIQLSRLSGDDVADVFEVLTSPDEVWEVRAIALRELTRRGRPQIVSVLLEDLPTATGTRLVSIINQLSASGDERAVPVLVARFRKAPAGEGRPFLQAIAQNSSAAAARALCELLHDPDVLVRKSKDRTLTTHGYIPLLLLNVRGNEQVVLDHFRSLSADQWRLRARLLPTLAGYAADRRDVPALRDACVEAVRSILFDPDELPQLRVQALNLLTRNWLTAEDATRMKRMARSEPPGMRALFWDFLNEYF